MFQVGRTKPIRRCTRFVPISDTDQSGFTSCPKNGPIRRGDSAQKENSNFEEKWLLRHLSIKGNLRQPGGPVRKYVPLVTSRDLG